MVKGFEELPMKPPQETQKPPKRKSVYYLKTMIEGELFVLWRTHSNGGAEWVRWATIGTKKPLRYKTVQTAQAACGRYLSNRITEITIGVWND
jgi:hypothetical protein